MTIIVIYGLCLNLMELMDELNVDVTENFNSNVDAQVFEKCAKLRWLFDYSISLYGLLYCNNVHVATTMLKIKFAVFKLFLYFSSSFTG